MYDSLVYAKKIAKTHVSVLLRYFDTSTRYKHEVSEV